MLSLTCFECGKKGEYKNREAAVDAGWTIVAGASAKISLKMAYCRNCFTMDVVIKLLKGGHG